MMGLIPDYVGARLVPDFVDAKVVSGFEIDPWF